MQRVPTVFASFVWTVAYPRLAKSFTIHWLHQQGHRNKISLRGNRTGNQGSDQGVTRLYQ
jgi:hypothetical protein